jgi:predicted Zn finger-like uncharacterized protein
MKTTCKQCNTIYDIKIEDIEAAEGQVVCSVCSTQFDVYQSMHLEKKDALHSIPTPVKNPANSLYKNYTLILLSVCFLPAQLIYFEKERLLQNETSRYIAQALCNILPCTVPVYKELSKIELISRKVHSHPVEKKALIITATVINNATQAQPFPKILISMSDIQGTTRVQRLFAPQEYLPDGIFTNQSMPSNTPLNINVEIEDPGQGLISFTLDFL